MVPATDVMTCLHHWLLVELWHNITYIIYYHPNKINLVLGIIQKGLLRAEIQISTDLRMVPATDTAPNSSNDMLTSLVVGGIMA